MIDEQKFNSLVLKYSPIIKSIIDSNVKYYRTNQVIKWKFGYDDRVAMVALCDKKNNVITLNIASVDFSFSINEPLQIEYFLLHEIRHIYQYLEIQTYIQEPSKCNNYELAKKWFEESNNYAPPVDKKNNENILYYKQDMEMDAFAYSYAVMLYKYGKINYLEIPKVYQNEEFESIVNSWLNVFKSENL